MEDFISDFILFKELKEKQIAKIKKITDKKSFSKNEIIFMENEIGNNLYIILHGLVRIYKTSTGGKEKTLALLGSGDYFGEMALLDNNRRSASAQTLQNSTLLFIRQNDFQKLITSYPEIALKIITTLSARLRKANQEIEQLTFHDVRERLTSVLNTLQKKYGTETEEGILIGKKITHQELANMTGTTRGTLTKTLNKLATEGEIQVKNGHIIVTDKYENN